MKVLITGGTGFLGRHLVWRLASEGHQIIFTGRQERVAQEVIKHSVIPVTWLAINHGSADAQRLLAEALANADAAVHCAALSSPWGNTADFIHANVDSTREVVEACKQTGVKRLVHISTPSIYFDFHDRFNVKENQQLPKPVNEYARTKLMAEQIIASAEIEERIILRPRGLFGPWDNTLMPRLLRVIERGPIPLMRGGNALLDLTYVENVVQAICLALTQPLVRPLSTYNVTNGEPLPLRQLLQQVAEYFHLELRTRYVPWRIVDALARLLEAYAYISRSGEPLLTRYGAGVLAFSQTLDISAIHRELGYQPIISLAEGMRRHADWYGASRSEIKT